MKVQFSKRNQEILNGVVKQRPQGSGLLFHGQPGSGLENGAEYFSLALNCENFHEAPCRRCASCTSILNNNAPDHISIKTDEKKIKIETIRNLQEQVKYGPSSSNYLVVQISDADKLTTEAANAFLKTLEEPENGVMFILMTQKPFNLLSTIRSRCQALYFPPITTKEVGTDPDLPLDLQLYFMENETVDIPFHPYKTLKTLPTFERMMLAQTLAEHKQVLPTIYQSWIREIINQAPKITKSDLRFMEYLINSLEQLQYNTNIKLQLESLLVQL